MATKQGINAEWDQEVRADAILDSLVQTGTIRRAYSAEEPRYPAAYRGVDGKLRFISRVRRNG